MMSNNPLDFSGKVALVTGAASGMGLATAERFAGEGFRVILSARNETKTKELAGQLEAKGHKVGVRTVDAADASVTVRCRSVAGRWPSSADWMPRSTTPGHGQTCPDGRQHS